MFQNDRLSATNKVNSVQFTFFFFEQNVIIFDCGHMEIICIEIHFECFQNR